MQRNTKATNGQPKTVTGLFSWWEIALMTAALLLVSMLR